MDKILDSFIEFLPRLGLSIITIIIGFLIVAGLVKALRSFLEKKEYDKSLVSFIVSFSKIALKVLVLISAISTLGIQLVSFIAVLSAVSFAIGLALQGNLSNFAAGVIILFLKPFTTGDFIEGAGVTGTVEEILMFSTVLKTTDNKKVIVPNSKLSNDTITNYSANDVRRVDFTIGVDYESQIDNVKNSILEVLKGHEKILEDKDKVIRLKNLGDSSIDFTVRVWVKTEDYWDVYFDVLEGIKEKLDKENISIPYPHVTVDMKKGQ